MSLWWREVHRCRALVLSLPLVTAVLLCPVVGHGLLGRLAITDALPIVSGLACAAIVAGERMVELHLTLPMPYPRTVLRRLVLLGGVTALGCLAMVAAAGEWALLPGLMGFALVLIAVAAWTAVRLRSAAAASTVSMGVWLSKILLLDRLGMPGAEAVVLAGTAVVLLNAVSWSLRDSERLMNGEWA